MNKRILASATLGMTLAAGLQAQIAVTTASKWDPAVGYALTTRPQATIGQDGKTTTEAQQRFIINTSDADAVAQAIIKAGYTATRINDNIITATMPLSYVPVLAEMPEVNYINASVQLAPYMASARTATKVDKIHNGEDLETPFTGKGVIVGVIDQSFEYRHRAFLDEEGAPRTLAVWNRRTSYNKPTTTIPNGGDGFPGSHATHVANIACGSKIDGNTLYGMAPEADIIMIPSKFEDAEVLEDAQYISQIAAQEGKPYVINMSFGGHAGPHDGTTDYCQSMNAYGKAGGILVAAMGNEGDSKLHSSYTFEEDGEVVNLYVKDGSSGFDILQLWGRAGDGQQHLKVRPFVYNTTNKTRDFKNSSFWNSCGHVTGTIHPNNNNEYYSCYINLTTMRGSNTKLVFGLEITGEAGQTFHAWCTNEPYGEFYKPIGAPDAINGDNKYCVGEGAATIPNAIAVGSYNAGSNRWTSLADGKSYSITSGNASVKGAISSFSNYGPFLGEEIKPLVVAPGSVVWSAYNSKASDFSASDVSLVNQVTMGTSKYYYGVMSGTSMASPAAAGIFALWLQANPNLSPDDITDIIIKTAVRDSYTGTVQKVDDHRGYGKINAYEGLKLALEMASNTAIHSVHGSDTPVTLMKGGDAWRILFNSNENTAQVNLYTASGQMVNSRHIDSPRQGQEVTVDLNGLQAGMYLISITTPKAQLTRKVMVK